MDGIDVLTNHMADAKYNFDLKTINPATPEKLFSPEYDFPSMIQVLEHDKKMETPVCKGAFGFHERIKDNYLLCIMSKYADQVGITFMPYITETIYCQNSYDERMYICLDDYFEFIHDAKIHELEKIAQCLGAKKVSISFKTVKKSLVSDNTDSSMKIKMPFNKKKTFGASYSHDAASNEFSDIKIASEIEFDGNKAPEEPELTYFKGNSDITSLIKMRLDPELPLKTKTYEFHCGQSREMREKDAAGIDAVLKAKGLSGNATMVSELQLEQRKILEYKIEF